VTLASSSKIFLSGTCGYRQLPTGFGRPLQSCAAFLGRGFTAVGGTVLLRVLSGSVGTELWILTAETLGTLFHGLRRFYAGTTRPGSRDGRIGWGDDMESCDYLLVVDLWVKLVQSRQKRLRIVSSLILAREFTCTHAQEP
jgi:hypothetical protein